MRRRGGLWLQAVQGQWRAADVAAFEAADGAVQADGRAVVVEVDDPAADAVQVLR